MHVLENRAIHNDLVRHREIIRALTTNHIRMSRFLKSLDDKNARLSRLVIILTFVAVIAGTIPVLIGLFLNLVGATTTLSPFTALLVEKLVDHRLDQLLDRASGRFARLR